MLAEWELCRQSECMPSVQVRDLPVSTHAVLRRRAAEEGRSLQEYLRTLLIEQATRPTLTEVLDRAGHRSDGRVGLAAAAAELRSERAER